MDSTGATMRTPRTRRRDLGSLLAPESSAITRSYDGNSFLSTRGLPPLAGGNMKTPRHSYHQRRADIAAAEVDDLVMNMEESASLLYTTDDLTLTSTQRKIKIGLYGILNTVILVPLMISFAQIIFRDPEFQPYMNDLVKLVLVSAAVHQICFTCVSSLPFAMGQVQDAGLIFLSAMCSSIIKSLHVSKGDEFSMEEVLATTLFTMAVSTAVLGAALIITGKLRLASFVQYLPMPVVGGYLAFIGFYALQAGVSMMTTQSIKEPADWIKLADPNALMLSVPGVVAGSAIFWINSRWNHMGVMPCCLAVMLFTFYGLLLITGRSLEDARAAGWVAEPPPSPRTITQIYGFYNFSKINFSHMTDQIPTWIAMYFVVAFSSSLDVAAVETALGKPLDHNHELQTVGVSNLFSGLGGGFTGSYLFSQTIFTLRGKLDSRYVGLIVFVLEIIIVVSPFSIIAYVPKVFFGALQMLVCLDLMTEWLWHARNKLLPREYGIVWLTFLSMVFINLELGIVVGIVIAGFNFIYSYVATSRVHRVMKRSRVERDLRERVMLQNMRMAIVTLELEGFIFFGSSVKVMDEVRRHVLVTTTKKQDVNTLSGASPMVPRHAPSPYVARSLNDTFNDDLTTLDSVFDDHEIHGYSSTPKAGNDESSNLHAARTRYFILDFDKVSGVDATAVRSCFNATKELLAQHGIILIFASVPTDAERLLRVHDVIEQEDGSGGGSLVFDTLDKALEWCEDELLVSNGVFPLSESAPAITSNEEGHHWQLLDDLLPRPDKLHQKTDLVNSQRNEDAGSVLTRKRGETYVTYMLKKEGDTLYRAGDLVNGVYFIGYGKVDVFLPSKIHEGLGPGFRGRKRITRVCQGGLVGASELILHKRHQFSAQAQAPTSVFFLSKSHYARMQKAHPALAARFQQAMLQSMAIGVLESNMTDD
ncbi:sulfate permease family [Plasmopara halstedii]|uniref:Sulfate permease family n=1 Tax=Plasmopara halstedii TaxID=4781 RepID=A0A0P1AI18_PLAHL|nr:sulfate permease family [Plasmopara halstedii]CEG40428.1 sulfate permease family [Plasmopara halstedii]|eukprot:XP_024576797.1 sulfate permease family [Plasmopara halstedii]